MLYIANDTEIRSFLYPFNQSHGHKLLTHIEDNARIIGMDALFHHQKFIWATQFNPGGIFYRDTLERSQIKMNVRNIVSISNLWLFFFSNITEKAFFIYVAYFLNSVVEKIWVERIRKHAFFLFCFISKICSYK